MGPSANTKKIDQLGEIFRVGINILFYYMK